MNRRAEPWLVIADAIGSFEMSSVLLRKSRRRCVARDLLTSWSGTSRPAISVLEGATADAVMISWCVHAPDAMAIKNGGCTRHASAAPACYRDNRSRSEAVFARNNYEDLPWAARQRWYWRVLLLWPELLLVEQAPWLTMRPGGSQSQLEGRLKASGRGARRSSTFVE